jgi:hypothetical protein
MTVITFSEMTFYWSIFTNVSVFSTGIYCVSEHYLSSYFYLKHNVSETGSVSVFRWILLSWAQSIKLVSISEHLYQHKIGYNR